MSENQNKGAADDVLETVDPSRRDFVRGLLGSPFVVPVITSFTLSVLASDPVMAQPNSTNS